MRNWRHGWWQSKRVFQRDDPRFRRLQLIQTILVIMQVYLFLVGLMNIFVFYIPQMAVVDFVGVGIASVLLHFLKQTQAIDKIAWVTVIAVALILIVFMHLADGRNYALYWLTVLPPIAFFLLVAFTVCGCHSHFSVIASVLLRGTHLLGKPQFLSPNPYLI